MQTFDVLFDTQKHVIKLLDNSYKGSASAHVFIRRREKEPKAQAAYYLAALLLCVRRAVPEVPGMPKDNRNHRNVILCRRIIMPQKATHR